MGISRNDVIDERGRIYCKRSWDSRGCARYRRPAMRLARSGKRTLAGRTSAPLIDEGVLSHILQECRAKALAAEGKATADSLYGSGVNASASGKTLFCNTSDFEGSIALKKRAGGHRRSISPTTPQELVAEEEQSAASARGPGADVANDKTPDSVPEVDENANDFQEEPTARSESRADNAQPVHEPVPEPVPEAGANDAQSLRTSTNEIGVQVGDAIPPNEASSSDGEAELSRGGSSNTLPPFTFMPGPPRRPSTPMRASSASLEAIFLQNADLYTCKSPIRPRTSKCPIMSPIDSPLSLYGLKCISSSTDHQTPTTAQCPSPTSSHPSAAALPFDFISVRNPTTASNVSDLSRGAPDPPAEGAPSPSGCLDSLMRHIFAFAAKWLPKLNPTSSAGPAPPSSSEPNDNSPLTHPQRATEPLPDPSDAPQDHRSTLLPPPSVVRSHSLRPNDHPKKAEDERSAASQSSGPNIATAHHVRSATAFSTPPRGWEQLFQPKEGEWKCEACYFINPSEALTCDSCTTLKDAPQRTNSSDVDDATSGGNGGDAVKEGIARSGGSSTEERNNDAEAPSPDDESETESEEEPVCDDNSPSKRIKVSAPTPAKARRTALTLSNEESESSEEEEEQEVSPSKRVKVSAPTPAKARAAPTPAKALRATTLFESVEEEEEEEREVSPSKRVKVGGGVSLHLNINATQPAVSHSLEAAGDGSTSKRIRRDGVANSNAPQSIFGHSPEAILKMAQKRGKKSGSGKRMKVDRPDGLGGDVYASGVSANAFGSTQPCGGTLNQQSTTMPRAEMDGLAMDESLSYSFSTEETVMEVESPRGSTMSFS